MRIDRLDLIRYGHFTETKVVLPAGAPDFHVVFGPNEAGKSTALSAIEDLLFGMPGNSRYNFLHDYASMRLGAVLQSNGKTLEIRRRKGNKDTLLTANEVPIAGGVGALAPFLAGADKEFFIRMFSLDHERLREGGREILDAKNEVGQMLFSAGAGLSGLRDRLKTLTTEADALWASRRAAHRKYYQALDRLENAQRAIHEHTVTAVKWQEANGAYDRARQSYDDLEQKIQTNAREQRKLGRIRRVYRNIRNLATVDEDIEALGNVVPLPGDAAATLAAAEKEQSSAATRTETLCEQIDGAKKARAELRCEDELLIRADDIQELHRRRIEVQKGKADLPHRRAELAREEDDLRKLAAQLEWPADDMQMLARRIPASVKVAALRALLTSRGERSLGVKNAKDAIEELAAQRADVEKKIAGMGVAVDVSKLAAIIKALRGGEDIASRMHSTQREISEANGNIERRLKSLRPRVADEQTLDSVAAPTRDAIQNHHDRRRTADQRLKLCRDRIRSTEQEVDEHSKAHERLAREEHAVTPSDVVGTRKRRDAGWLLIRRRYIDGVPVPEKEIEDFTGSERDVASAYEAATTAADALVDLRFDRAEAAARIALTSRQIAEGNERLEGLRKEEAEFVEESRKLDAAWNALWAGAPFEPLAPDMMLEWLGARDGIHDAIDRRDAANRQLEALRDEEAGAKGRILSELATVTGKPGAFDDQPLRVILEAAAAVQGRHEKDATARKQLEESLQKMETGANRKNTTLAKAATAWQRWQESWAAEVKLLDLAADMQPETAAPQLDTIDRMRVVAGNIHQLQHERIGMIERDISAFAQDVAAFVSEIAAGLAQLGPDEAVLELERRLETAKKIREEQKLKEKEISALEEKIADGEASGRDARAVIQRLQQAASVEDIDQLKSAIRASDEARRLTALRAQVADSLAKDGDGLPMADLNAECEGADIDQVAASEQALDRELKELRERLAEAAEQRAHARGAFEAIGGDDRAANAAAERQSALAELHEVAQQFVRVRSSATLLQWAIERYRREKQAPLLRRAGEVFATLTGGSFSELRVEFDESDNPQLAGIRPGGDRVHVGGMSTGTADQLYLALRVASIEDYLGRAEALPFIADDLFINFDNDRAAAGFKVLGELARKTQILFFTHHQHLVSIAQRMLGKSMPIVTL